jgi:hypothetical protein
MDHSRRAYHSLLPLLCVGLLWACNSRIGGGGAPDPDGDVVDVPDADLTMIELDSGIGLSFAPSPGIGVSFNHDGASVELKDVHLEFTDLRLIGDAATGDDRTSKEKVVLKWNKDNPDDLMVAYDAAPPGMYSHVRATVKRIKFKSRVSGSGVGDFELEIDEDFLTEGFELALDYTLEAGTPVLIEISIDFAAVLSVLDFDTFVVVDGEVELESGADLDNLVGAFPGAISVKSD